MIDHICWKHYGFLLAQNLDWSQSEGSEILYHSNALPQLICHRKGSDLCLQLKIQFCFTARVYFKHCARMVCYRC
jgi:hypothetical protein